jgi:hypothetical protein
MISAHKSSNADNLNMPKRSHKLLPLTEKMNVLNLIRKEKNCLLRLLRSMVRRNPLSMKLRSVCVVPQTAVIMQEKSLLKMEKALNLCIYV